MKKFLFTISTFLSVLSMEERCVRVYNSSDQSNPKIFISGFSPSGSSSSGSENSYNSSAELSVGEGQKFLLAGGFELFIKRRVSQEDDSYLLSTYQNKSDVVVIHLVSKGIRIFRSSKPRYSPY